MPYIPNTREEIIAERKRLKAEYRELFYDVSKLLFQHDPIGINFEDNTDEYEPEVGTILPKLRNCESPEDVCKMVHQEFTSWFGASTAGPEEHYSKVATEIWEYWQRFNAI
jgi:hypothetical protein